MSKQKEEEVFLLKNITDIIGKHARNDVLYPSLWAEKNRVMLDPKGNITPFSFENAPYQKFIVDCFSKYSKYRRITIVKGARVGATEGILLNVIGYNIDVNKHNMYFVSAEQRMLDTWVRSKFDPFLKDTGLSKLIKNVEEEKARIDNRSIKMFSAYDMIIFAGANNPNNFRTYGGKTVFMDEVASYPIIKNEGSIIKIAEQRTASYGDDGIICLNSTPLLKNSDLYNEYINGTQHKYFVPCPICGKKQIIEFGKLDENKKLKYGLDFKHENYILQGDVKYKCKYCKISFPEGEKRKILNIGEWRRTNSSIVKDDIISFHISSLISNFASWRRIVQQFLDAKKTGNPAGLQSFNNLVLGEFWEYQTTKINIRKLRANNILYNAGDLPYDVDILFFTGAIDVQGDRLEIEIKGWCKNYENYSIEYIKIMGDTNEKEVWEDLKNIVINKKYICKGQEKYVTLYGIDSGDGNKTKRIYEECEKINYSLEKLVILPIKGKDTLTNNEPFLLNTILDVNSKSHRIRRGKQNLLFVNTIYYKDTLFNWNDKKEEKEGKKTVGYTNFPSDYEEEYFKMLQSEEKVIEYNKYGQAKIKYRKIRERNEALDLFVYNIAIMECYLDVFENVQHIDDF